MTVYLYAHRHVGNTKSIDNYLHWTVELIGETLDADEQSSDQGPVEQIAVLAFTARVIAERGGFELTPLVERICRKPLMALTMTTQVLSVYIKIPRFSI